MDPDEYEPGKLFVGGLSWETGEEDMKAYFEQFGVVTDCVIMRDQFQPPQMKKNRGFGFVQFEDPAVAELVVATKQHILNNKRIDPKLAQKKSGGKDTDKKVFLGGLNSKTTEEDVKEYFNTQYGGVTDVVFKVDKLTNRKRGFGFVVFESPEYVERVLQVQYHEIDGKQVEVKRTEPRSATASAMRQTNPALYAPYSQPSYPDYRGSSNGHPYAPPAPPTQWGHPPVGQHYYDPYVQSQQAGYGQQYSNATGYSTYDHSSYPRTQTSTDRQDTQSYYQQQHGYGHGGAQQLGGGGYGQETASYPAVPGRAGYQGSVGGGHHGGYGQQPTGYGRGSGGQPPQQQQQPRYGAGVGSNMGGYGH